MLTNKKVQFVWERHNFLENFIQICPTNQLEKAKLDLNQYILEQ